MLVSSFCLPLLISGVPREHELFITLGFVLCLAAGIALGLMGALHFYLVLTNQTTIELYLNRRARMANAAKGDHWWNPYDLGKERNFLSVFAPSK